MKGYVAKKGSRWYAVIYEGIDPLTGKEQRSSASSAWVTPRRRQSRIASSRQYGAREKRVPGEDSGLELIDPPGPPGMTIVFEQSEPLVLTPNSRSSAG